MARKNKRKNKGKLAKNYEKNVKKAIDLFKKDNFFEAYPLLQEALIVDRHNFSLFHVSGVCALKLKDYKSSIKYFSKALKLKEDKKIYMLLAHAYKSSGDVISAIKTIKQAINSYNDDPLLWLQLGKIFRQEGKIFEAMNALQKANELDEEAPEIHYSIGKVLFDACKNKASIRAFENAYSFGNKTLKTYLSRLMAVVPILAKDEDERKAARNLYEGSLVETIKIFSDEKLSKKETKDAVISSFPYFLAPFEKTNKPLQEKFGGFISKKVEEAFPKLTKEIPKNKDKTKKIKVGFVCSFVRNHSVWKIPLKGWLENINKEEFETSLYFTGEKIDEITNQAVKKVDNFITGFSDITNLANKIKSDENDVLIYPEIGMDGITFFLSSLRLSPVQAVSLGHPETTGLKTIDYYLSSDLMEPKDAQNHYTEELVRLANLGVYYERPVKNTKKATKSDFQINDDSIAYVSCQTICKYLPKYDDVFAKIAQKVKNAQFVFVQNQNEILNSIFHKRLENAFSKKDLDYKEYCVFVPKMSLQDFDAMLSVCDVYLDNLGWSGNNSTCEAVGHGVPIVTRPGEIMRTRHSYGILKMLGIEDTIAKDVEEYINLAVKLGTDKGFLEKIKEKFMKNKNKLYEDDETIKSLEDFIKSTS